MKKLNINVKQMHAGNRLFLLSCNKKIPAGRSNYSAAEVQKL